MKTKLLMSFCFFGSLLFSNSCKGSQQNPSEKEVVDMLNNFYISYITESAKLPNNVLKLNSLKEKYCTSRLLREIEVEELDYDPFLKAQDSNTEWLKSLNIKKDETKEYLYYVYYTDDYSSEQTIIRLVVVKEKESYKIDSIL